MTVAPTITLASGSDMPRLGLGTWPMDDAEAERAVATAIEAGYRLFDTAENYGNEVGVGRGIRASGIARDEIFVTTKFNKRWHGVDLVVEACDASAQRLGVDVIDLLLIHWPNPRQDRYVDAWRGLLALRESGRVRAIGVSNFKPAHLERIIAETGVAPEVNQIDLNPALARADDRAYDAQHGIVTESWSPLGGAGAGVVRNAVVKELAARYDKTPAQIVLRWHMELGLVTVPKSNDPERIRQNIDIFDFALTPEDVVALSGIDDGSQRGADSDRFGH